MGGSSSKQVPTVEAPQFDYSKATVQLPDLEEYEDKVKETAASASAALGSAVAEASKYQGWFKTLGWIFLFCVIAYVCYHYLYPWIVSKMPANVTNDIPVVLKDLSITSAMIGEHDVKQTIIDKVSANELHIQIDETIGVKRGESIVVTYQYPNETPGKVTVPFGKMLDIVPAGKEPSSEGKPSSWWDNKNLMSKAKSAKEVSTVSVPDNGVEGSYGYQFWMYVTDWNYKFGQEKHIMSRADPTNSAIMNPLVTLHPTDNTMKVSVSIFPSTENSSKAEPAPAGHSGSTDDVFVCEIPNIPLQTWLAVAVTVSTRNLDVYLNGKLVKSCLLSGVPKTVSGSVTLNSDGGFSGWMCAFYHYAKLLVPAEVQSFYNSGVPCNVPDTKSNYKVQVGFNDTKGEVVSKYMF
jgi:hypothetical protein